MDSLDGEFSICLRNGKIHNGNIKLDLAECQLCLAQTIDQR